MKRIFNKKYILGFITGILVSTITVYAVNYAANEISFTTSKNSNVHTVKDALDDLYSKKNVSFTNISNGYESNYIKVSRTINVNINKGKFILIVNQYSSDDNHGGIDVSSNNDSNIVLLDNVSSDLNNYTNRVATIQYGASSTLKTYLIDSDSNGIITIATYDRTDNNRTNSAAGVIYSIIKVN